MRRSVIGLIGLVWILAGSAVMAQTSEDCFDCHSDNDLTTERKGVEVSLYVAENIFAGSVHGDMDCVDCHADLADVELPHEDKLEPVDCSMCHDDVADIYTGSLHGQAVKRGDPMAPVCWNCHGKHDIEPSNSPDSKTNKFNIPFLCGSCHKEGSPVMETHDIPQDSIVSHYSQSIHGEGLFRQGLTVTAVCTDCHTSHNVLPHTDPKSSINRDNVVATCQQCHGRIEEVHRKIIRGELWETEPDRVPVCVDCHAPHEIRNVYYDQGMADRDCMICHGDTELLKVVDGDTVSLWVDTTLTESSIHRKTSCAQCHTGISVGLNRPCETVINKVDCSICHTEVVEIYATSTHGQLADRGDPNAPECEDCHGTHGIRERRDIKSPTYPTRVPELCGSCHREGEMAAVRYQGDQHDILENYIMSIHGKGLLESGLVVTAMCTDCHTAHHVLPASDTLSSVNRKQIPNTCATCHSGIYEKYRQSIHFAPNNHTEEPLPTCHDCHQSHTVSRTDKEGFKFEIINQCGRCHEDVMDTYFETFHGKVSKLGYADAAKCYDCHGAHEILPVWEPKSTLSRQNIIETCGQCHEGSHRQFAGYLTHATHHDRDKYPILFYTFWFMTILLIGTLIVAGTHTLLWLPRSFITMRRRKKIRREAAGEKVFQRFKPYQRRLHILVIISFLSLAITGMTLKFSYLGWAQWLSSLMGGFETAAYIHRLGAIMTFVYFFVHLYYVRKEKRAERKSWKQYLLHHNSMLPNMNDLRDLIASFKWFIGLGKRPDYGRWTYWEKFDYFAVFWGVAIIGATGLMLWFPVFFTRLFPGWFINVATIVHSDEALLAVAFIFTVHFFNTHFRPDRFPMDTVIFTGRMPVEELKEDRPREYAELVESGELKDRLVQPLPEPIIKGMRVFGATALIIGMTLILLIIYAEVFGYR